MVYFTTDVDIDVDEVIDNCRGYIIKQLKSEIDYELLQTLHRIQDYYGEQAVLDKLKDLYQEHDLYVHHQHHQTTLV